MVVGTVIRCQCDDGVGHLVLPPWMFCAQHAHEVGSHSAPIDANGGLHRAVKKSRDSLLCNRQLPAQYAWRKDSARALIGSAWMPVRVREMNPAKPKAALRTTPLRRGFASYFLLRNSLAQALLRFFSRFDQGDLPELRSQEFNGPMISHAKDILITSTSLPLVISSNRYTKIQFLSTIQIIERASYNGSIEASQASDVGSIPIARSIKPGSGPGT